MYKKPTVYANIVHLLTKRTKQVVTISGYDIGVLNTLTNIFALIKEYLLYSQSVGRALAITTGRVHQKRFNRDLLLPGGIV